LEALFALQLVQRVYNAADRITYKTWGTLLLCDGSAVGCHQSLGCAIRQSVNCRQPSFSGCRPSKFFTGARGHGSNTPVLQETLENVLTATIVLTSTLVVLEVTSVTVATIKITW